MSCITGSLYECSTIQVNGPATTEANLANNLFISYDLINPGQNYDAVQRSIMELGRWYKMQYSLFYVSTRFSPQEAYHHVSASMDWNDRLLVIEARGAVVSPDMPPADINAVNTVWFAGKRALPNYATGS